MTTLTYLSKFVFVQIAAEAKTFHVKNIEKSIQQADDTTDIIFFHEGGNKKQNKHPQQKNIIIQIFHATSI